MKTTVVCMVPNTVPALFWSSLRRPVKSVPDSLRSDLVVTTLAPSIVSGVNGMRKLALTLAIMLVTCRSIAAP
jgi:hypothetical protein